jgi:hypothetical protein
MEKQHGKDLHPQRGQAPLLPLLDQTHLNSIISIYPCLERETDRPELLEIRLR